MKIAIVAKIKHGKLYELLRDKGWSQSDLARHLGVAPTNLSRWMNLKSAPTDDNVLRELERLTYTPREELFPSAEMERAKELPKEIAAMRDVDIRLLAGQLHAAPPLALEEHIGKIELQETIEEALAALPEREALVLAKRFGLDGEEETPVREIGLQLGVSAERIRQIEHDAMRRLYAMSKRGGKLRSLRELR